MAAPHTASHTAPHGAPPSAAQPPRRADARQNRERVLAAAREVFTESGPEASLNEIARRAGVGPGTLYRHFPNRHALVAAVVKDRVTALCGHADGLLAADRPADEALADWLRAFLEHARTQHGMGVAAMIADADAAGGGAEAGGELDLNCHLSIHNSAEALLGRAREAGSVRRDLSADDLIQLVVGIALSTARSPDPDQPERLLALVLDAARPR
ncbi:TetR/AcrR family transcriptional regulator [Yinghuangia soli]|uniref:TetR/AcrR family transcriptional regulator n=1 Tax=Yinghuangia soli TaxID=2908204 RepID=A0AA41TY89_9ACTN|nr:TetR/AcrR family transcriptional regulator [Yinghuangia soli]MCF2527593.1 TetR/AcrR family transcriptional regulator [Yinghuangia soli]